MSTEQAFADRVSDNQRERASQLEAPFDYIVCGAGTAGCVVAARLAEDGTARVLLIEAGSHDDSDLVRDPDCWPMLLGSERDWGFVAEPNPHLDGRALGYSMGKGLGGGSSINVSTWSRGHQADWDFYARQAGNDAWAYGAVLALYRERIEAWAGRPDSRYRGDNGRVHVQPSAATLPFSEAILQAAAASGLPRFADANGAMMEAAGGCSLVDETVRDGRRRSIFRSYVHPLMDQPNLTVLTGALASRILFEGRRATGVVIRHQGRQRLLKATREIVLSLGAIHTPKLLMQSGIGPEAELKRAGILPLQVLEGVGRNLHDHVSIASVWAADGKVLGDAPRSQTACFWKSRPELDSPNLYTYAISGAFLTPENAEHIAAPAACWTQVIGMRPQSRGSVHLTGAGAEDPVRIDANYLADPQDMADLMCGLEFARKMGSSPSLAAHGGRQVAPPSFEAAALARYVRRGLSTFWHQSGTASMGRDAMAVVDGTLNVYGVEGLRVADASVLPRVTSGNTMAPCVVIGERAAEFMRRHAGK